MADREARREGRGYRVILTGVRGILRLLVVVCLLVVLIYLGRRAYSLGHEAFDENPVDIGEGRTVVVTVTDDMSTYQIGRMLRAEGLLTESALAFWLQELISEYHGQILPGTYALKTSMTTQDMFPILAQADKMSESEYSTFIAPGMQAVDEASGGETAEEAVTADSAAGAGDAAEAVSGSGGAAPEAADGEAGSEGAAPEAAPEEAAGAEQTAEEAAGAETAGTQE